MARGGGRCELCSVHLSAGVVAETDVRATCHYSLHIAAIITAAINSPSTPHRGSLRHCRGRLPTFAQVRFGRRRPMQLWILSIGTCGPATSSEGSDLVLRVLVLANLHCRRLYPPCPSDPGLRCPSICFSYTSLAGVRHRRHRLRRHHHEGTLASTGHCRQG